MKLEDYSKYYIQGSDHYLVPKDIFVELFNEMINWKQENEKLTESFTKYKKKITPIKMLQRLDVLEEENEELKKQLEAGEEQYNDLVEEKLEEQLSNITLQLEENKKQQEFIKYLTQCVENEEYCYMAERREDRVRKDIFQEILQKYKEIIGDSDEKDNN